MRVRRVVQRIGDDRLDDLSTGEQRRISSIIVEGSDDVGRAMADGGPGAFARAHKLGQELDGVDPEQFASAAGRQLSDGEMSRSEFERLVDDLETLHDADIDGVNRLVRSIASDTQGFESYQFEAKVGAAIQRSDLPDVKSVSKDARGTEFDVVLEDGSTVEVKSADLTEKIDARNQLSNQIDYRQHNDMGGSHYVVVRGTIGETTRDYMQKNGIERLELSEDL